MSLQNNNAETMYLKLLFSRKTQISPLVINAYCRKPTVDNNIDYIGETGA
ncbi:hypothetical protein [Hyunsoonleella flava]|nr:hypothetical protein [Hyunsoonleella flava]